MKPTRTRRGTTLGLQLAATFSVLMVLIPLFYLVVRALEAPPERWREIFSLRLWTALLNTLSLSSAVTLICAAIATPLAWLTTRTNLPLRRLWTVLAALPLVIPSYIGAYLMLGTFGPGGVLARWFSLKWLPPAGGFWGALYLLSLLSYPYLFLSLRAAWLHLDPSLEEAGRALGHSRWQVFWKITLPQLQPAFASGSLLIILYVMRDFGAVAMLRYDTFTRLIYVQYQALFDRNGAAILGLVLVILTLSIVFLQGYLQSQALAQQQYASKSTRTTEIISLNGWTPLALLFCTLIAAIALGLPLSVLIYWLIRSIENVSAWHNTLLPLGNSLFVAVLASVICTIAAYPIARLNVRYPSRISRVWERLIYNGYALPGLIAALALVFFSTRYLPSLYQSLWLLLIAYWILFLPEASGALRTALLQISPTLEEAARSLGLGRIASFVNVTLPLMQPGLRASATLVFLNAIKELPATLILSPLGFETLPVSVWMAVNEAYFAQAAIPALLLIITSSVPAAWLMVNKSQVDKVS